MDEDLAAKRSHKDKRHFDYDKRTALYISHKHHL